MANSFALADECTNESGIIETIALWQRCAKIFSAAAKLMPLSDSRAQ
jgi:hypothetical protein